MPANLYSYDPTGADADNLITLEEHSVTPATDIAVFPLHGPVYAESFVIETEQAGTWVELTEQVDYVYSPLFLSVSASTRKDVVSYALLLDTYTHTKVRLRYQAVGMYEDLDLLQEITDKTDLDRSSLSSWLSIRGQVSHWPTMAREPGFGSKGLLEIFTEQAAAIRKAIANPYTSNDNLSLKVTSLEVIQNTMLQTLDDFIATISNTVSVTANTNTDVFVGMWSDTNLYEVVFESDDNTSRIVLLVSMFAFNNTGYIDIINEHKVGSATITATANVNTGRPVMRVNVSMTGTIKVKALGAG